ncbi:MAG: hypothetical protein EZS28_018844 [Streblomastix strix]|uniref:OTU domain-containing protein n=1 Tax=Streblomastix strix TaxID=222440 RepID=A0A5J4VSR7_9EUKA|nr:MAG: hypothetical protein EZS28_018844 [Streblomastix strix]
MDENEGENKVKKRGGDLYEKISPKISLQMSQMISKDATLTSKQIKTAIQKSDGIILSESNINRHIRKGIERHMLSKITIKKLQVLEEARNSEETKDDRIRYIQNYNGKKLTGGEIIIIDESSFELLELRNRGRSTIGTPAITNRKRQKIKNITAVTSICSSFGVLHITFIVGSNNSDTFILFLDSLFDVIQKKGLNQCILIMDNSLIHHTEEVQLKIQRANHFLLYTAKWSPELNPIEYVFRIWKRRVRIPASEVNPHQIVLLLNETFASISILEVRRCILMVEILLFPRALRKENLKLKLGMDHISKYISEQMKESEKASNVIIRLYDGYDEADDNDLKKCMEKDLDQLTEEQSEQKQNNEQFEMGKDSSLDDLNNDNSQQLVTNLNEIECKNLYNKSGVKQNEIFDDDKTNNEIQERCESQQMNQVQLSAEKEIVKYAGQDSRGTIMTQKPSQKKKKKKQLRNNQKNKPKIINIPEYIQINELLQHRELVLKENDAMGDCFFRSVSEVVYGTQYRFMLVRNNTAQYMIENLDLFEDHFVNGEKDEDVQDDQEEWKNQERVETLQEYSNRMRKQGEWASQPIMLATAFSQKRRIEIISLNTRTQILNDEARSEVVIAFVNNCHYMAAVKSDNLWLKV